MLGEAVTVQDAAGRMVYANEAAARLVGSTTADELLAVPGIELAARFDIFDADGERGRPSRTCRRAGCSPASTRRRC